jgi:V-type H+-transporting ATPase subunit H
LKTSYSYKTNYKLALTNSRNSPQDRFREAVLTGALRTFDEYASELESGHLSWTPPHRSDDFWRENAAKLIEGNNKLLKVLAKLLATSKKPLVLAVGCHDIGQLVKQVPQARSYVTPKRRKLIGRSVQGLGTKTRIMELMGHSDPDVRYEALSTVQLLMSGQFL